MFLKSERVISELAPTVRLNTFSSHLRKKIPIKNNNSTKITRKNKKTMNAEISVFLEYAGTLDDCWFIWKANISTFWDRIFYENERRNEKFLPFSHKILALRTLRIRWLMKTLLD